MRRARVREREGIEVVERKVNGRKGEGGKVSSSEEDIEKKKRWKVGGRKVERGNKREGRKCNER